MKIRTDFVTNSSSSSFILKDTNMGEIYQAFEKKKHEILTKKWYDEEDYNEYLDWLKGIKPIPIHEHGIDELTEVLGWYEDEILAKIFEKGVDAEIKISEDEYWHLKPETEEALEKCHFTDESLEQIMRIMIVDCIYEDYPHMVLKDGSIQRLDYVSREAIQNHLVEILSYERCCCHIFIFIVSHYYEKVWELAEKFANRPVGEIVEELFVSLYGARYMYFDDYETHYLISNTIGESPICVLSCNHMG